MKQEDLLTSRFRLNMGRIAGLTKLVLAPPLTQAAIGSEEVRADVFRSIVVFLHATFEDSLRTAARERLGDAAPTVLNGIPLVGTDLGRAEKFYLGSLAAHRGKTVDHLIQESVEAHLTRQSFNSCADVDKILEHMGLDTNPFKFLYPYLDGMIKKRHRIVHEGDLPSPQDTSSPPWTIVDHFQLCLWNLAILAFHALLRVSLDPTDELQRWYFERRRAAIDLLRRSPEEMVVPPDQYADATSMMVGFRRQVEELMQEVIAQLGPPSQEELLALDERSIAYKAE